MQDDKCTSTNDSDSLPTNDEPRNSRQGAKSSSGKDDEWFPTRDDAATFAQASHSIWPLNTDGSSIERASDSIWSSIIDEGNSPESGDALSDSDTAVDDQAAEITAVISKLNEKRNSLHSLMAGCASLTMNVVFCMWTNGLPLERTRSFLSLQ
jgi:hypothetical protein